ncbi:hypothetical protein [Nocardia amamiensis]|uniref:hypothetical protein n=1 Tax=Nocardia amamiensis TaxID=404578 RepID=UPI000A535448|nr:hypothetical protein [Nocardia amamiensis]
MAEYAHAVPRYLGRRFPPAQAAAGLSIPLCSFLVYGACAGRQAHPLAWVGGACAVVAMLLMHRLADDVSDAAGDPAFGIRGMLIGAAALVVVTVAANAAVDWTLGIYVLATAIWSGLGNAADRRFAGSLGIWLLSEVAVAMILFYPYLLWRHTGGGAITIVAVVGLVGGSWSGYLFWVLTRKAARTDWLAPGVSPEALRGWLSVILAASGAAAVLAGASGALPLSYPLLGLLCATTVALLMLRWRPARSRSRAWAGLTLLLATQLNAVLAAVARYGGI